VWFRVGLGLDPASVGVLQAVSPVVTAVFIMAAQSASAKLGERAFISGPSIAEHAAEAAVCNIGGRAGSARHAMLL